MRLRTHYFLMLCSILLGVSGSSTVLAASGADFDLSILSAYQCSDGLDNDFDGLIDFPNDLGCLSSEGLSEYSAPIVPTTSGGGVVLLPNFGPLPDLRTPFRPGLIVAPQAMQVARYATLPNEQGGNRVVPVFTNNRPRFVGKTDLKNTQVVFTIRADVIIRGSAYTDAAGEFSWQAPEFLHGGLFTLLVSVHAQDDAAESATTAIEFILDIPEQASEKRFSDLGERPILFETENTETPLFDIFVKINPQTQVVGVGGLVEAVVDLVNFGSPDVLVDVPLQYYIEDSAGKRLLAISETRAVKGRLAVKKIFTLPQTMPSGSYVLVASVPSRVEIAYASDTFIVDQKIQSANSLVQGSHEQKEAYPIVYSVWAMVGLTFFSVYFQYSRFVSIARKQLVQSGHLVSYIK